jgi:hypothetical protein
LLALEFDAADIVAIAFARTRTAFSAIEESVTRGLVSAGLVHLRAGDFKDMFSRFTIARRTVELPHKLREELKRAASAGLPHGQLRYASLAVDSGTILGFRMVMFVLNMLPACASQRHVEAIWACTPNIGGYDERMPLHDEINMLLEGRFSADDGYEIVSGNSQTRRLKTVRVDSVLTADNVARQMREHIDEIQDNSCIRVVSVVTDNAANMLAAVAQVPVFRVKCACHTLNLLLVHAMTAPEIDEGIELMRTLKRAMEECFTPSQLEMLGISHIMREIATRWHYTCACLADALVALRSVLAWRDTKLALKRDVKQRDAQPPQTTRGGTASQAAAPRTPAKATARPGVVPGDPSQRTLYSCDFAQPHQQQRLQQSQQRGSSSADKSRRRERGNDDDDDDGGFVDVDRRNDGDVLVVDGGSDADDVVVVETPPPQATTEDAEDALLRILEGLDFDSFVGLLPKGAGVEVLEPALGDLQRFAAASKWCERVAADQIAFIEALAFIEIGKRIDVTVAYSPDVNLEEEEYCTRMGLAKRTQQSQVAGGGAAATADDATPVVNISTQTKLTACVDKHVVTQLIVLTCFFLVTADGVASVTDLVHAATLGPRLEKVARFVKLVLRSRACANLCGWLNIN